MPLALSALPREVRAEESPTAGVRDQIPLNGAWQFRFGAGADTAWAPIQLPHTWNAEDGQDGADGSPDSAGDYRRGPGWYRCDLQLPQDLADQRLFLQFDGANTVTDVWVNGAHLGQHRGGYTRFRFDATDHLRPGRKNELVVRVSNAEDPDVAPLSADFTFFGGLYRGVSLQVTGPVHMDMLDFAGPGVYLRQREVSAARADVDATVKLANDSEQPRDVLVRARITDADDRAVFDASSDPLSLPAGARAERTLPVRIDSPRLWNGRTDPHVHRAEVAVHDADTGRVLDVQVQPLGLRWVSVSTSDGVSLNGSRLQLRGVNRHQDREDEGFALESADHEQDFALMREMGVNALRTAHYPQDQEVYELADSSGFAVYSEVPWVNAITDSEAFRSNVKQQLREMIRQHYNHPSVLFWGIGNELGFDQRDKDPETNALLAELAELVRVEDPERASGYANVIKRADDDPFTEHADLSGYNRYEGWYESTADQFGAWADSLHARNPERKIGVAEYGAGANIHQHAEPALDARPDPDGPWHPEEYQSILHESYLEQINARPYLWGTFVWNMFDFASDGREEGGQSGINDKGLVTHDRKVRKDAFYWYKANWSDEPVTYITSRRWTHRTEPSTAVRVYSNAERVELTVNGESLGTERGDGRLFTWRVRLRPGANTVVATAVIDGEVHSDTVVWELTPRN